MRYNDHARLLADRVQAIVRGKSGRHRGGQSLTATGRKPRESATETKQRNARQCVAMVKRAG
jgi:hypothetical protein